MLRRSTRGRAATVLRLMFGYSILGAAVSTAFACPRCYTSAVVREAVLGPAFFSNVLVVSLPFLVLGALAALAHRIGDRLAARTRPKR